MLRANHSEVGRRSGLGLGSSTISSPACHRCCWLLKTLPTGSLQTKNGSAKIYYKNSHSSGRQAAAYYVKSAQHTQS